jgi:purine-binding chemotaxis protein CheW
MDLAKIRQKARKGQLETTPVHPPEAQDVVTVAALQAENGAVPQTAPVEAAFVPDPGAPVAQPSEPVRLPRRSGPFDPIEAILAGRVAAGCNDEPDVPATEQAGPPVAAFEKFLCFRVSDEIYGINIMQIKEIIKPREVTEVPRAPSFVSGVISLRGVIIPILDMLDRLGLKRGMATGRERVVVVKHGAGFSGLLVDEVIQVVRIAKDSFEPAPAVLEAINREFVAAIGRSDGRMIILLNLDTIADINLFLAGNRLANNP